MKDRFLKIAPLLVMLAGCNGIGGNDSNGPVSEDNGPIAVISTDPVAPRQHHKQRSDL